MILSVTWLLVCITPGAGAATNTKAPPRREVTPQQLIRHYNLLQKQSKIWAEFVKAADCPKIGKAIIFYRGKVWEYQDFLDEPRSHTNYPEKRKNACPYKHQVVGKWRALLQKYRKVADRLADQATAICYVFGEYCQQALAVARCESGRSLSIHAKNGQYLGMFQMGSSERRIFGHGNTPLEQARAAHRYFVASGRDWSPWSCKPW